MNGPSLIDIANRQAPVANDERRTHERVGGRLLVRIGTRRALNRGLVHNLSMGGMGVYTRVVYPPGTSVSVSIESPDGGPALAVEAEVRWNRIVDGSGADAVFEMGVRLLESTPAYTAFFAAHCARQYGVTPAAHVAPDEAPEAEERRLDDRRAALLPVEFVDPPDLAPTLTRNIAGGGALVEGCAGLTEGAIVVVDVRLPEIPEAIRALGVVRHIRAASAGDPGGVGLSFLRFYAGGEDRLHSYLERLREDQGILAFPAVSRATVTH